MQVLTVDIGTGTQDIYLFQSGPAIENNFKLVMPSPTMKIRSEIQEATSRGETLLLTGVTMGGGPSHWAAEAHLRSGFELFATPDAARTFNDDLEWVQREMGVQVISLDEANKLGDVRRIEMRDFDYGAILEAFGAFGLTLSPDAAAVAVFDHGAAPPNVSDRQFRFDYLEARIRAENNLTAFAYLSENIPEIMTRMLAVAKSAEHLEIPLLIMDTAPAAVLGATLDPWLRERHQVLIANIGNFHTLAFRLGPLGIEGLFEHHTGEIDLPRLDALLLALAEGTLSNEEVFNDQGHGALILADEPLLVHEKSFGVAVTGPRRAMIRESTLNPYFAVPFGDMMLSGCFGLLLALAERVPTLADPILSALTDPSSSLTPWDL